MAGKDPRRKYLEWRDGPDGQAAMTWLRQRAREAIRLGRRTGIKRWLEELRWQSRQSLLPDALGFVVNNSWAPFIARDLVHELPPLADLIELRRAAGEDHGGRRRMADEVDDVPEWVRDGRRE